MLQVFKRIIPYGDSFTDEFDWQVGSYEKKDGYLVLTVQHYEWSKTFFKDRHTYDKFTKIFKTTTGSWNGNTGYWLTAKAIQQTIICKEFSNLKIGSKQLHNRVTLNKNQGDDFLTVHATSAIIGLLEFDCVGIHFYGEREIALFNSETQQWAWYTHSFDVYSHFEFDTDMG